MSRITGLLCVLVQLARSSVSYNQSCRLDHIPYVDNFQEEKYLGLWYEIRWYAGKKWTPADINYDYTHYYYKRPGDDALYCDKDYRSGMTGECQLLKLKYIPTVTPGRYLLDGNPFYIVSTDYGNYSLDLTCTTHVNGSCLDSSANVWSRRHNLSADYLRLVEDKISRLCAPSGYINIINKEVCSETYNSGSNLLVKILLPVCVLVLILMVVAIVWYIRKKRRPYTPVP